MPGRRTLARPQARPNGRPRSQHVLPPMTAPRDSEPDRPHGAVTCPEGGRSRGQGPVPTGGRAVIRSSHGRQRLVAAPGTSPPYNRSKAKRKPGEGLCEGAGRCVADSHDGDSACVPCVAVRRRMHGRVVVLRATVPFFASAVSDGLGGGAGRCVVDSHDGDSVGVSCVAVRRRMHGRVTELRATHPFFASAERSMQKTPVNQNQTLNTDLDSNKSISSP